MRITVVGTGYQGLVLGTCLAENGHQVTCVDKIVSRIEALSQGTPPIHEPGLEELVSRNLEEERLFFTTDLDAAVSDCLVIFLCVGTPAKDTGDADIGPLLEAVKQIAAGMNGYRIIINKSTCPPGTAEEIDRVVQENTKHPCDVVVNPDFLKEGTAVDDFMRPDRVILGCDEVRVREILKELYGPFLRTGRPCLFMSKRSAEMTKYATNAMLAARISLMNQFADLCEAYDADVAEVREGVATDERIGPTFLFPGLGFGGSGLPRDLATCVKLAKAKNLSGDMLEAIHAVNARRLQQFLDQLLGYYDGGIAGKRIALWGASFKPRTDDLRGAPAVWLIEQLLARSVEVIVYDPVAGTRLRERFGDRITIVPKSYVALEDADGLAILTEWTEFRRPDYARMAGLMRDPVIFDGRNLYTPAVMREQGFKYFSIGRPPVR